jgi:hypothetical protein
MFRVKRCLARTLLLLTLLCSLGLGVSQVQGQEPDYRAEAQTLLESMSPAERVGQLFLVTFSGADASADSAIADLILNHYISGVVLLARNDNIVDLENTPGQVAELANSLQYMALQGATMPAAEGEEQAGTGLPGASPATTAGTELQATVVPTLPVGVPATVTPTLQPAPPRTGRPSLRSGTGLASCRTRWPLGQPGNQI